MTPARFLETRRRAWARLDQITSKARGRLGSLSGDEVHELVRLYPAVAVDVARARMYDLDTATQRRINDLAVAAHGLLYRPVRPRLLGRAGAFFIRDYPRLFRRLWAYVGLSAAITLVVAMGAWTATRLEPATAYIFMPHGLDVGDDSTVSAEDVSERYRMTPAGPMSGQIALNNIKVAAVAFALGITAGVGTVLVLVGNAIMIGTFIAHFQNHGLGMQVAYFLTGHGALEIFAILVAGGAGLRLGLAIAMPGHETRRLALRTAAREAVLLLLGTVPMFLVAAVAESFLTPSYVAGWVKIAVGLGLLGLTVLYLFGVGHEEREPAPAEAQAGVRVAASP